GRDSRGNVHHVGRAVEGWRDGGPAPRHNRSLPQAEEGGVSQHRAAVAWADISEAARGSTNAIASHSVREVHIEAIAFAGYPVWVKRGDGAGLANGPALQRHNTHTAIVGGRRIGSN